jgi:bla regulator protein blaR1
MRNMSLVCKLLPAAIAIVLVAAPCAEGFVDPLHLRAQLLLATANAPSFEVATIKPSPSGGFVGFRISPARFSAESATVKELIKFAYNINSDSQLEKGPDWISSTKFDVDAAIGDAESDAINKLPPDQWFEQYRLMVQSLLANRFNLKVNTETKQLPVLALIATKDAQKLTPASAPAGAAPQLYGGSRGDLTAKSVSMKFFADFFLSGRDDLGGRVVTDATGLQGRFDFTLKWSRDETNPPLPGSASQGGGAPGAPADNPGPSLVTALQEQLGFKLEPRRAPVEVLVIDHIEQPSPN